MNNGSVDEDLDLIGYSSATEEESLEFILLGPSRSDEG